MDTIIEAKNILISYEKAGVAVIALNRPGKRNALSQSLIDELTGALCELSSSPIVRTVVLSSFGESPFCGKLMSATAKYIIRSRVDLKS